MPEDPNTLFDEAKCFRCNSDASLSDLLKLGLWQRLAGLTDVDSIVDSFVERSGISDQVEIDAVSNLVTSARVHGWWNKCDLIYPFVGGTAGAHAQNLKSSNFTITWNGTVTHDANGITGDGATGWGDTGYVPSTSGQITLNSVHIGVYKRTNGVATTRAFVGGGSVNLVALLNGSPVTTLRLSMNDPSTAGNTTLTSLRWVTGLRDNSSSKKIFENNTSRNPVNFPSAGIADRNLAVLAIFVTAAPQQFSDANIAGATAGSAITFSEYQLMSTDWQTFQTALGRQV